MPPVKLPVNPGISALRSLAVCPCRALVLMLVFLVGSVAGWTTSAAQQTGTPSDAGAGGAPVEFRTPQEVVDRLYDLVTFDAGTTPDWSQVRRLFIDQAVIVIRTSLSETSVFSVEGFVQDFITFIDRADVKRTGFVERIIRTKATVFGDIAHLLVLYEAKIPGSEGTPQRGVDSFQLIWKGNRWWIASVVNEIPLPNRPLPPELQE